MTSTIRLWDFESEIHYEDFTFSDIMETEDRDREEHDVLAFVFEVRRGSCEILNLCKN